MTDLIYFLPDFLFMKTLTFGVNFIGDLDLKYYMFYSLITEMLEMRRNYNFFYYFYYISSAATLDFFTLAKMGTPFKGG